MEPGFERGGAGEPRFIGPSVQSGHGPLMGEIGGVLRDRPDPRRARRPHGPVGWAYGGLGYEPEPPGGFSGVAPRGYRRSDRRVLEDVCDELTDDDRLDASDIEVSVEDGVVVLRGTVTDRVAKRRAEDIADRVRGVEDVVNELRLARARPERGRRPHGEPSNGGHGRDRS